MIEAEPRVEVMREGASRERQKVFSVQRDDDRDKETTTAVRVQVKRNRDCHRLWEEGDTA